MPTSYIPFPVLVKSLPTSDLNQSFYFLCLYPRLILSLGVQLFIQQTRSSKHNQGFDTIPSKNREYALVPKMGLSRKHHSPVRQDIHWSFLPNSSACQTAIRLVCIFRKQLCYLLKKIRLHILNSRENNVIP